MNRRRRASRLPEVSGAPSIMGAAPGSSPRVARRAARPPVGSETGYVPGCTMIVVGGRPRSDPGSWGSPASEGVEALPSVRPDVLARLGRDPEDYVVWQDGIRQLRVDPDDLHASAVDGRAVGGHREDLLEADLRCIPAVERRWCRCASNVRHSFEYAATRNTFVPGFTVHVSTLVGVERCHCFGCRCQSTRRGTASAERVLCARRLEHRRPNCGELVTQLVRGCGAHRRCRRETSARELLSKTIRVIRGTATPSM